MRPIATFLALILVTASVTSAEEPLQLQLRTRESLPQELHSFNAFRFGANSLRPLELDPAGDLRLQDVQIVEVSSATFIENHCLDCHSGEDSERGFDLDDLSFELADTVTHDKWVRALDRVQNGEMPPPDAEKSNRVDIHAFLKTLLPRDTMRFCRDPDTKAKIRSNQQPVA